MLTRFSTRPHRHFANKQRKKKYTHTHTHTVKRKNENLFVVVLSVGCLNAIFQQSNRVSFGPSPQKAIPDPMKLRLTVHLSFCFLSHRRRVGLPFSNVPSIPRPLFFSYKYSMSPQNQEKIIDCTYRISV